MIGVGRVEIEQVENLAPPHVDGVAVDTQMPGGFGQVPSMFARGIVAEAFGTSSVRANPGLTG